MSIGVPPAMVHQVDERDQQYCRFCGKSLRGRRVIHHIRYGGDAAGMGGARHHDIDNLISLCSDWDNGCHMKVHADKLLWQPILINLAAGEFPGVTAMQMQRWAKGTTP